MRVLLLDSHLDIDADSYSFKSGVSLYDYDVVIWDPQRSLDRYTDVPSTYRGQISLYEAQSAALVRDIRRRRSEFKEFVEMGRCLVVFMPSDTQVWVDSGEREYSGTGRNRTATRLLNHADIVDALPIQLDRKAGSGLEIEVANDLVAPLFWATNGAWVYRCTIEKHEQVVPLLKVRGTEKTVGGLLRATNRGRLVLLPELFIPGDGDEEDYDGYEDEDGTRGEGGEESGSVASDGGYSPEQDYGDGAGVAEGREIEDSATDASAALLIWIEELVASPDAELPPWAGRYRFHTEVTRAEEQRKVEEQMSQLQAAIDELKAAQVHDDQWKVLFVGSGSALERQVARALEALGFEIEERTPGRSDLRARRDGDLAVVEVKGLTKSAAEKNSAQLEKWVSEEIVNGRTAKGILVVNTWRKLPLDERIDDDFPEQMIPYATQRNHCLITGMQLLAMARAALYDPSRKNTIARMLMNTVGVVDNWIDLSQTFSSDSEKEGSGAATANEAPVETVAAAEEPENAKR